LATPAGLPKTKNIKTVSCDEEPRRKAAKQMEEIVSSQRPLPIDGAADNLPNLRIRQE
jgi:hypothetical protein